MIAVVAVRIHEFFPGVSVLKPVLLITIVGIFLVYRNSSQSVRARVWHAPLAVIVLLYFIAVCLTVPFALWQGGAFQTCAVLLPAVLLCPQLPDGPAAARDT